MIERITQRILGHGPSWNKALRVVLTATLVSLFFSFPSYNRYQQHLYPWEVFFEQVKSPLTPTAHNDDSHFSKTTFRLFPPLLAKVLGIQCPIFMILIQGAFAMLALLALWHLSLNFGWSETTRFWFLIAQSLTLPFGIGFVEVRPLFDGMAISLCLLTLSLKAPGFWSGTFLLMALFCDERSLLAIAGIFLFRLMHTHRSTVLLQSIDIFFAILFYAIVRMGLSSMLNLQMSRGGIGLSTAIHNNNIFFPAQWSVLELGLPLCFFAMVVWFRRSAILGIAYILYYIFGMLACCFVWDVSRSMLYMFPVILMAAKCLSMSVKEDHALRVWLCMAVGNALFFNHFLGTGSKINTFQPMIVELVKYFV